MIAGSDIFSLILGAFYSFVAPFAAYLILCRRAGLQLRDILLGVLGALLWRMLQKFATGLVLDVWPRGIPSYAAALLYSSATGALLYAAVCFVLLRFAASRSPVWAPSIGYGIGFGGCYGILAFGAAQIHNLKLALALYEAPERAWLYSGMAAERFVNNAFSDGIPAGATAIAVLLTSIGTSMLIWRGLREENWRWIGAAILLNVSLTLPLVFLHVLGLRVAFRDYYPFVGLVTALFFAFARRQRRWLFDAGQFQNGAGDPRGAIAPFTRLLSTWLEQRSTRAPGGSD